MAATIQPVSQRHPGQAIIAEKYHSRIREIFSEMIVHNEVIHSHFSREIPDLADLVAEYSFQLPDRQEIELSLLDIVHQDFPNTKLMVALVAEREFQFRDISLTRAATYNIARTVIFHGQQGHIIDLIVDYTKLWQTFLSNWHSYGPYGDRVVDNAIKYCYIPGHKELCHTLVSMCIARFDEDLPEVKAFAALLTLADSCIVKTEEGMEGAPASADILEVIFNKILSPEFDQNIHYTTFLLDCELLGKIARRLAILAHTSMENVVDIPQFFRLKEKGENAMKKMDAIYLDLLGGMRRPKNTFSFEKIVMAAFMVK